MADEDEHPDPPVDPPPAPVDPPGDLPPEYVPPEDFPPEEEPSPLESPPEDPPPGGPVNEPLCAAPVETAAPVEAAAPPARRSGPLLRSFRRVLLALVIFAALGPPVAVLAYKVIPPPITWLMIERLVQGQGLHKHWVSLDDIDPSLPNAVIAAEDQRFCAHHGFDFEAMQAAMRANERHPGKLRGGSTISQQTAKNVFLWPGRDYVRKGLEAYFTVLIETVWGKRRIMEMYLNVAEWGPGTYGAEAAARRYFNEPATDIDPGEASHLAAILPSPLKWKAVNPGRYVQKRSSHIGAAAGAVRRDGLAECLQ